MPDHLYRVHPFHPVSLLRVGCDDDIDAFRNTGELHGDDEGGTGDPHDE